MDKCAVAAEQIITNFVTLNKTNLLFHSFHGSGVWVLISWFLWSHLRGWNQAAGWGYDPHMRPGGLFQACWLLAEFTSLWF